jgi:hypothetical protein
MLPGKRVEDGHRSRSAMPAAPFARFSTIRRSAGDANRKSRKALFDLFDLVAGICLRSLPGKKLGGS